MKSWLRNKLHQFLYPSDSGVQMSKIAVSASSESIDMDGSLRFNVLNCRGGVVLQLYRYDHKRDRSDNSTHLIPENENVAERIGQIVSLELLKN